MSRKREPRPTPPARARGTIIRPVAREGGRLRSGPARHKRCGPVAFQAIEAFVAADRIRRPRAWLNGAPPPGRAPEG